VSDVASGFHGPSEATEALAETADAIGVAAIDGNGEGAKEGAVGDACEEAVGIDNERVGDASV
jgi:hypothetical protein